MGILVKNDSTEFSVIRNSRFELFCKKDVLKSFAYSQENTCATVSLLIQLQVLDLQLY